MVDCDVRCPGTDGDNTDHEDNGDSFGDDCNKSGGDDNGDSGCDSRKLLMMVRPIMQ